MPPHLRVKQNRLFQSSLSTYRNPKLGLHVLVERHKRLSKQVSTKRRLESGQLVRLLDGFDRQPRNLCLCSQSIP